MDKTYDKFSIMVVGDERVGKTSLLERYFNKTFVTMRKQTIGVDNYERLVELENKQYLVKVWDTAGQEKFAVMAKNYYQRAHGMIIVCAINDRRSFENVRIWLASIKESAEEDIQIILVANKCDLQEEREIPTDEIRAKAEEYKLEYFETSSKENTNVNEAFDKIIQKIYHTIYDKPEGIVLYKDHRFFFSGCCK